VARTLLQIPREIVGGDAKVPERAMLQSYVLTDAFKRLYATYKPRFATLHLNNVAYMQHRYWRAAEPDRFRDELSLTDQRFFDTVAQRRAYERSFADWIERSLVWTDRLLGDLLGLVDDDTVLLVGTALGQKPHDPRTRSTTPSRLRTNASCSPRSASDAKVLTQITRRVLTLPDEREAGGRPRP
jgi:hypothetical protein